MTIKICEQAKHTKATHMRSRSFRYDNTLHARQATTYAIIILSQTTPRQLLLQLLYRTATWREHQDQQENPEAYHIKTAWQTPA